jgi:hypothetical protein
MLAEGLGAADQIAALLASCPQWQDPAALRPGARGGRRPPKRVR